MKTKIIITCEHAGNKIPSFISTRDLFSDDLLNSHKAWDIGALDVAKSLRKAFNAKLFYNKMTRVLVDFNRGVFNQAISKKMLKKLKQKEVHALLESYNKYRDEVFSYIEKSKKNYDFIFIFSIHSFVPVFNQQKRKTDIGILFRQTESKELLMAKKIKENLTYALKEQKLSVHFNRPYRGHTDCFFNDILDTYKNNQKINGTFLEINQRLLLKKNNMDFICQALSSSIASSLPT